MTDQSKIRRRDDLMPLERAVSDTLDEWLSRLHGIFSSWASPIEFIDWLDERGYIIVAKELNNKETPLATLDIMEHFSARYPE